MNKSNDKQTDYSGAIMSVIVFTAIIALISFFANGIL